MGPGKELLKNAGIIAGLGGVGGASIGAGAGALTRMNPEEVAQILAMIEESDKSDEEKLKMAAGMLRPMGVGEGAGAGAGGLGGVGALLGAGVGAKNGFKKNARTGLLGAGIGGLAGGLYGALTGGAGGAAMGATGNTEAEAEGWEEAMRRYGSPLE